MINCKKCGAQIEENAKFCPYCGDQREEVQVDQNNNNNQNLGTVNLDGLGSIPQNNVVPTPPSNNTNNNQPQEPKKNNPAVSIILILLFFVGIAGVLLFTGGMTYIKSQMEVEENKVNDEETTTTRTTVMPSFKTTTPYTEQTTTSEVEVTTKAISSNNETIQSDGYTFTLPNGYTASSKVQGFDSIVNRKNSGLILFKVHTYDHSTYADIIAQQGVAQYQSLGYTAEHKIGNYNGNEYHYIEAKKSGVTAIDYFIKIDGNRLFQAGVANVQIYGKSKYEREVLEFALSARK